MNYIDKQYLDIMRDIIEHGSRKQTRAGEVLSVFDRTMRFDLRDGSIPLLTTKKVFTKGCIYELLWFLSGNTNIKYLVDHGVNIWTDDAYRYYLELVDRHNRTAEKKTMCAFYDQPKIEPVTKEQFVENVKNGSKQHIIIDEHAYLMSYTPNAWSWDYTFGDLGDVYGKQWRSFGYSGFDQIQHIIDTLKTNPDDRRMLCVAFNPDAIYQERGRGVALPPCHILFQFWTRELSLKERLKYANAINKDNLHYKEINVDEAVEKYKSAYQSYADSDGLPTRELSLVYMMRSNDWPLGQCLNSVSYSCILRMIAELVNMAPGELVYHGTDVHIYTNQLDGCKEQLSRQGSDIIPKLKFTPGKKFEKLEDFEYEDFIIEDYYPDPVIKFPLSVG